MSTLYLTEQGSKLRKTSQRLLVERGGVTLLDVPAHEIDHILIFGAVQISTQAISFLLSSGIEVSFLSMNGRLKGRLTPVQSKNVFLRLAQYDRYKDEEFKLITARSILEGKMKNQRTLLLRYQRNRPEADFTSDMDTISRSLSQIPHESTISALMGLEGASTRAYYNCYATMLSNFVFEGRNRRPPLDPVNALLSLGYVLIANEMSALMESTGFDPFIGFMHGLRYGRQSLPLDMIEEFRHPVIDGLVQSLTNKESIKEVDFHKESDGAVLLNKESLKRFFSFYEDRMEKSFKRGNSYTSYRKVFREQVDNMRQTVLNRETYQPFLVR
ncbi:MAG: CRISPR-associated endonuclease Cas1 [Candidatus Methanogaster sp.]|uniref:CRISPR-associated endonuclease Cas1 n=1 Tax=Candidatus Methanogaster sp. TaxID=3386292 RepID=A0AC61L0K3_9EURY|nr:MAG: CRISPR-associated endonuclease Cas1 [ANME-2 cluster archaeon]